MRRSLMTLCIMLCTMLIWAQDDFGGFGGGSDDFGGFDDFGNSSGQNDFQNSGNQQQMQRGNRSRRMREGNDSTMNDSTMLKMRQFWELVQSGKYNREQIDSIRKAMGIPDMQQGGRGGFGGQRGQGQRREGGFGGDRRGNAESMPDINQVSDFTLDSLYKAATARPVAGSSRIGRNPVLFLIGNSTMRTGTLGNGNNGQWGWGYFLHNYFDLRRISVENHALGGTSSRTFYKQLWKDVLKGIRPGDWVIIELGHNDNGPFDSGRARASIKGIGKDSLIVTIQETGVQDTVYSYGEYLRRFIDDIKAQYAHPIIMSLTPRNDWREGRIVRVDSTFGLWARQIAKEKKVPFIDLNDISASRFERFGPEKVNTLFYLDKIHSSVFGAKENAASAAEGIARSRGLELKNFLKPLDLPQVDVNRQAGKPVVFYTGDSTVKNEDSDDDGMWGWGSVTEAIFDTAKVTPVNCAMAGRSTRTFLDEGRWEKVYNSIEPGDYVVIQFGHNDIGEIEKGKARGVLPGTSDSSKVFLMEKSNSYQVIYTFGWYLRKFVYDVREKGGIPILLSLTPRNEWENGKIERRNDTYGRWMKEVAEQTGALLIDLHNLTADYLDGVGAEAAKEYYKKDHTHTSKKGALLNAQMFAKGLKASECPLKDCLK